jgi:hypothetical protein
MEWMASFMRVLSAVKIFSLILMCGLHYGTPVYADTFKVTHAKITSTDLQHRLSAIIQYPLTPRVIEAIDNSVPITFFQEIKLVDHFPILGRYWQWKTTRWQTMRKFEIRYHALTERYILKSLSANEQESYLSLKEALSAMGQVKDIALPNDIDKTDMSLLIRSGIDLNALPTPMRPGALISDKWQLNSPWSNVSWE